jgi:hypothetical protein
MVILGRRSTRPALHLDPTRADVIEAPAKFAGVASTDLSAWLREAAAVMEAHLRAGAPRSFEGFVLEHGRKFEPSKLTDDERKIVDSAIEEYRRLHRVFHAQQCFVNSQSLLGNDDSEQLVYVEGFAWTHALHPVLHGWLTIDGKVIDVTLPPTNRREAKRREPSQVIGEFEGRSYFGVPFLRSYVMERREITGSYGSLLDDDEHDFPLLVKDARGAVASGSK